MGAQGRRYRAFRPRGGGGCERCQFRDGGACLVLEVSRGGDTSRRNAVKPAYRSLALQTIVSGVIMYLVMFVMIDRLSSFYNNLNMLYMTLMMVSPMVVLMIVAMPGMFTSKRLNTLLLLGSAVATSEQHTSALQSL